MKTEIVCVGSPPSKPRYPVICQDKCGSVVICTADRSIFLNGPHAGNSRDYGFRNKPTDWQVVDEGFCVRITQD